jgi:LysM repeat protein
LYPGLGEEQFDAIIRFAYREKWPLMARGLFELLQKLPAPKEESLCQAFSMTSEFSALQRLFQKTEAAQDVATLMDLATEGTWDLLGGFTQEQAQLLDLSVEKRRRFLLSCLAHRSKTAAKLLLKTDFEFSFKRLDDRGICDMLMLLQENIEEVPGFCVALLASSRSDLVRKTAAERLYAIAGEVAPTPFDVQEAIARFCPAQKNVVVPAPVIAAAAEVRVSAPPVVSKSVCYHTVAEGDTLWKIARQYKVKVEDLVQINDIENGRLYPGMTLQVP